MEECVASFFRVEVIMEKLWPGYRGKEWRNMVDQNCERKKGPMLLSSWLNGEGTFL
jgi:hypothetical protein